MFGRKPDPQRDAQKSSFVGSMLTGISLVSMAVLILTGPDFYHYTKDIVWGFLSNRYAPAFVPIAFGLFYLCAYPAAFFLMRASWSNPAGLPVLWIADRIF
ncbi:MAG: hypothetical protein AAF718_03575 [Pseudomonadota bacterium]